MLGSKSHFKNGKNKRCVYSHQLTEGKEVILVEFVLDYVKSLGYLVSVSHGFWSETC